jgi:phage replication-related protein YjqB (UPF0714/DUF867 family)
MLVLFAGAPAARLDGCAVISIGGGTMACSSVRSNVSTRFSMARLEDLRLSQAISLHISGRSD